MKKILTSFAGMHISVTDRFAQHDKFDLLPAASYDRFIVYQNLVIFWIGIISLIVIIKMKLKEVERIQKMGINKEEKNIPVLD